MKKSIVWLMGIVMAVALGACNGGKPTDHTYTDVTGQEYVEVPDWVIGNWGSVIYDEDTEEPLGTTYFCVVEHGDGEDLTGRLIALDPDGMSDEAREYTGVYFFSDGYLDYICLSNTGAPDDDSVCYIINYDKKRIYDTDGHVTQKTDSIKSML